MDVDQKVVIGPVEGSGLDGADLVVFVAGSDGRGKKYKAAVIGQDSEVAANIYAPNGSLWLKSKTKARGAFIGQDVQVDHGTQIWLQSAFGDAGPQPPVAGFSAAPLSGSGSLTVAFSNTTTGEATGYTWLFGDGETSTLEHPSHVYTATGVYTVSLTAIGPGGVDTLVRPHYITVTDEPTPGC